MRFTKEYSCKNIERVKEVAVIVGVAENWLKLEFETDISPSKLCLCEEEKEREELREGEIK